MFVREINKLNLELTIGDFLSLPSSVLELAILVKIAIINKNVVSRADKQLAACKCLHRWFPKKLWNNIATCI